MVMYRCFVCKEYHNTIFSLCQHLKFQHGLYPGYKNLRLKCGQPGCAYRSFSTYSGFKKHLGKPDHPVDPVQDVATQSVSDMEFSIDQPACSTGLPGSSITSNQIPVASQLTSMCGSVVAHLQGSGLSETIVQTIVSSMEEIVNDVQGQARGAVLKVVSSSSSDLTQKVEDSLKSLDNPFSMFNSEAKRKKYYYEKWEIVEPEEYVLGVRLDVRRDRITGVYSEVPVTDKYMYVPILSSLKSMFKNNDLKDAFLQDNLSEKGIYKDIRDGSYFQNHPLFAQQRHALQLLIYYDDFETANPLGSKRGIHKLGCVYFTLKNLPSKFNSVLLNVHLVSLFHTADVKTYGFDEIMKPLIRDLKILETQGVQLPFFDEPLLGTVFQITGDNLALHTALGYVESFSATHCCRFCLTNKEQIQSFFSENHPDLILRSKALYAEQCEELCENPTLHVYGVKKPCVFNSLQYFHSTDNYAVDIMHDLLEGVVQYELKLVFFYLVKQGYVSMGLLSDRIQSFNYGYTNRKNRPSGLIMDENSKSLGLNATQSWCGLRNTPLIFGDVIERGNGHWSLLLILLQIVNIVFSPVLSDGLVSYLKHLISDHHALFKSLFPEKNLIPKHHFMLHYPRCIRKIGPLLHVWCMRFEAKHRYFKKSIKNFKHITKTLVKQHQRQLAFQYENYDFKRLELGPIKTIAICKLEGGDFLKQTLNLEPLSCVSTTKWVKVFGTEYQVNLFVCTGTHNDLPVFKKICNIFIHEGSALLLCCRVDTLYFDEHLYAYCIEEMKDDLSVVHMEQLTYFKPFDGQYSNENRDHRYLVPYCFILDI